jgi:hypothetical protein
MPATTRLDAGVLVGFDVARSQAEHRARIVLDAIAFSCRTTR